MLFQESVSYSEIVILKKHTLPNVSPSKLVSSSSQWSLK